MVDGTRYQGIITLLAAFSLQLAAELDRLLIAEENVEPPVIRRARQFINANLKERIPLEGVANGSYRRLEDRQNRPGVIASPPVLTGRNSHPASSTDCGGRE